MIKTSDLIHRLAAEIKPTTLANPWSMLGLWVLATCASSLSIMAFMGLRPDIAIQLKQPIFLLEISTLIALILSTALAAVWRSFPDQRQKPWVSQLPLLPLGFYCALIIYRLLMPESNTAPLEKDNGIDCGLCITAYAIIPASALFMLIRRGATTTPSHTGAIALLAAANIGHLVLKFVETNDAIPHLLSAHFLPILLLGALGWLFGKKYFAW